MHLYGKEYPEEQEKYFESKKENQIRCFGSDKVLSSSGNCFLQSFWYPPQQHLVPHVLGKRMLDMEALCPLCCGSPGANCHATLCFW